MDIFKLGDKILALLEAVFGFWNNQISLVFAMLGQSPVPGSGKSFFCKMEMGSVFLSGDDEIIVIDPMNEYFDIAETYGGKMAEVIGVSEAQLRFVTNTASGMGLLKCGSVVIPFDNQISKDTDLYRLYNTNIHEKIAEQKKHEMQIK